MERANRQKHGNQACEDGEFGDDRSQPIPHSYSIVPDATKDRTFAVWSPIKGTCSSMTRPVQPGTGSGTDDLAWLLGFGI